VDQREKRMAQNEALFREVSERIKATADGLGSDVDFEYFCECANPDCTFQVSLTAAEYENVRTDPTQFFVLPRHFTPEIETLASENKDYWIVRKTGDAGAYVEQLDPRSRRQSED
jgi:hypothetical protein